MTETTTPVPAQPPTPEELKRFLVENMLAFISAYLLINQNKIPNYSQDEDAWMAFLRPAIEEYFKKYQAELARKYSPFKIDIPKPIDFEAEMSKKMAKEIQQQIDRRIMDELIKQKEKQIDEWNKYPGPYDEPWLDPYDGKKTGPYKNDIYKKEYDKDVKKVLEDMIKDNDDKIFKDIFKSKG